MMASRPKMASSHGRPAAGMRPCGVAVIIIPMSADARCIQALNGASVESTWHGGRPSTRASSSAAASDRVKVAICIGCSPSGSRMASEMVFSPRLPICSRYLRLSAEIALGQRVTVDHGLAHDFVGAETSLDHAVALDALEARARRVDAALRAHIDDVLEIRAEAHDELRRHRAQREIAHADHLVADARPDEARARDVQRAARQHDAAALAAHVGVGEIHRQQDVVLARRGGEQQRPLSGDRQREARQVTHAAAIQARLAARLRVDVTDFVEEAEAVVVPQDMRAIAARDVGSHDLVQRRLRKWRVQRPMSRDLV